jgi:hypothetical protein
LSTEAASLVNQVRAEKVRLNHQLMVSGVNDDSLNSDIDSSNKCGIHGGQGNVSVSVTLKQFSGLVERCLKKKGGRPGRGYLFLRDKTTKETVDWATKREEENTFVPNTDKVRKNLAIIYKCFSFF